MISLFHQLCCLLLVPMATHTVRRRRHHQALCMHAVGGWSVDQQGPPPAANSAPMRGTDESVFYTGVYAGAGHPAGADAVFVHSDWCWSSVEAHNFASAGAASLRLVMAMNKVSGFRELYNKLSSGEAIKKPTFEQVRAAIALTESQNWMWNKGPEPWKGVGQLPSEEEAQKIVGQWMGFPAVGSSAAA
jgi:hypothetical protein